MAQAYIASTETFTTNWSSCGLPSDMSALWLTQCLISAWKKPTKLLLVANCWHNLWWLWAIKSERVKRCEWLTFLDTQCCNLSLYFLLQWTPCSVIVRTRVCITMVSCPKNQICPCSSERPFCLSSYDTELVKPLGGFGGKLEQIPCFIWWLVKLVCFEQPAFSMLLKRRTVSSRYFLDLGRVE